MDTLWAFLGISVLVIVTPGPDTAVTVRNTLLGGRRAGVFTALGIVTGQAIWALATSVGLVALLVASEPLFLAIKYAGAAYLVFLGLQALHAALRPAAGTAPGGMANAGPGAGAGPGAAAPRRGLRVQAAFRQGLISDLGNPKMAVFFASILPQFAPRDGAVFSSLILLGLLFCLMAFLWLAAYAAAVALAGDFLRRSGIYRAVEAVTGTVLVALGLRIATEQR